jgi:hypothetical protein
LNIYETTRKIAAAVITIDNNNNRFANAINKFQGQSGTELLNDHISKYEYFMVVFFHRAN